MQKPNNNKKGFDGLSNLSSDIDDLLEENEEREQLSDKQQNKINNYPKSEVDKYNLLIDNYNDICYNKQYYKQDENYAQKQIDKKKKELEQEGIARFTKNVKPVAKAQIYSLTVSATPSDAVVKILNINPKYYDGIKLEKGDYHIYVSKDGYKSVSRWINIKKDEHINITLEKNVEANIVQPSQPIKTQSIKSSSGLSKPNMSNLLQSERNAIEKVCSWREASYRPADYYKCIRDQMNEL